MTHEPGKVGKVPQSDGLVGAGGGQGASVRGKRHRVHCTDVAAKSPERGGGGKGLQKTRVSLWASVS
jgi:hypothetical protein